MGSPSIRRGPAPERILVAALCLIALAPRLGYHFWGVWNYRITNALYFAPQYVFPFGYTWQPLPEPSPDAHPIGHWMSALVWAGVVLGFGRLGRRLGWRGLAAAVPIVVVAVAGAQQVAVRLLGWHFWCDGP